ncbi:MAG: 4-hydroxy-2-oxovalerate aldolase [Solirubrobacterales bacterium]|nr:4-hydroxy-2-oxovalerate aldolase [Solirubrobacterales bacterium]
MTARRFSPALDVRITDTSLRDGSHAVAHRFTVAQVRSMVAALDQAGVPVIEVSHGDGLGGSSLTYGRSGTDERELIAAACETATSATIAALVLPGVGTAHDIRAAKDLGIGLLRVATHASEADISAEHFTLARELGLETAGFLMMSHTLEPRRLAAQARIMADNGCQCVYVVDSAGALVLDEAADRVASLVQELGDDAQVGFHAHRNLGVAEANTVLAVRAGAVQVDGSLRAFGAGAGNAQTEVVAALLEHEGLRTGIDVPALLDAAEEVAAPLQPSVPAIDRDAITLGRSGVYSSFLKHARRIGERYGVPSHELLRVAGERRLVGGQEDLLVDIAVALAGDTAEVVR